MSITENVPILRFHQGEIADVEDVLVTEGNVAIELRRETLIRATCSPNHMREWVIGHLFSEGYIVNPDDVSELRETDGVFSVELAESAPSKPGPLVPVVSDLTVDPDRLLAVAREVAERADVFHRTGGTHAMAVSSTSVLTALAEDISRTCGLEKALGLALVQRAEFGQSFAFLSSRVPSRMIAKLARCGIPIAAAVSAPTIDAVRLAERLNVCLCGFVRDERLNVYAHAWRVGL